MMNSDVGQTGDLQWQAFRYVGGEMDADEMAAFEEHMLLDPAACEAVARTALLCERVYTALETDIPVARPARRYSVARRISIGASLAAAAGAVLFALFLYRGDDSTATLDRQQDIELVRIWAASRDVVQASRSPEEADSAYIEAALQPELNVPEWMLMAVRLEQPGNDDDVLEN